MKFKANFMEKPGNFQMDDCEIEKVVELSHEDFCRLKITPLENQPFLAEHKGCMFSRDGVIHCLLALDQGGSDGILVDAEQYDFARLAAYLPGMRDIVNAGMDRAAGFIIQRGTENAAGGNWRVYFDDLEKRLNLTVREGSGWDSMLRAALKRRPEVEATDMHDGCIELSFRPEYCRWSDPKSEAAELPIRLKDILPIREEEQLRQQDMAASQKYAVFRVRENGQEEYFRLDQSYELLQAARTLWKYLRQEPEAGAGPFSELFPKREAITPEEFDRMVRVRMENTGKVTGAFDIDFDKREFSAVNIMDGWKTFAMGDVSVAACHAFREEGLSTDGRYAILLDKLDGREITSASRLSAMEISFADEIGERNGLLHFYIEAGVNVDTMFGIFVCAAGNDDTLNVYANYDMAAGQVCDELEADLHRADGQEDSIPCTLNAAEKEVLLRKMDAYCQEQTGRTLVDYSAQLMAEDMAPQM